MYKISRKTSVHCDVKQTFIDTMIKSIIPRNRFFSISEQNVRINIGQLGFINQPKIFVPVTLF